MRVLTSCAAYLLANRKLAVGAHIRLKIRNGQPVILRVTRCATLPTGGWALICGFDGESTREVSHWLKPARGALDQRQSMRLGCSTLARFCSDAKPRQTVGWARLADISACGACLVTNRFLSKGQVLKLDLGARKPLAAVGQVAYSRQQSPGAWTLGCHLHRDLAEDELWQLVSDVL
jgi:hypothetical protein